MRKTQRLLALLLMLALLLPCFGAAVAEPKWDPQATRGSGPNGTWTRDDVDGQDIAESKSPITVDGVTYYYAESENVNDKTKFYNDLLGTPSSELDGLSIADQWLLVGMGCLWPELSDDAQESFAGLFVETVKGRKDIPKHDPASGNPSGGTPGDPANYPYFSYYAGTKYGASLKSAFEQLYINLPEEQKEKKEIIEDKPGEGVYEDFSGYDNVQDVVATYAIACHNVPSTTYVGVAVYFTDFQVVALLPDAAEPAADAARNYVSKDLIDRVVPDKIYASNVKNLTLSPITSSQSLSTGWSSSLSSTVNESSTYSYAECVKSGIEIPLPVAKVSFEVSFTTTQAITKGWSQTEALTQSGSISDSVTVALPPYTQVVLEQGTTDAERETRYNCPMALKYKVRIMGFEKTGADTVDRYLWTFKDDGRADLYKRAIVNGKYNVEKDESESKAVNWNDVEKFNDGWKAVDAAAKHAPMSPTGAKLVEHATTNYSKVKSIAPTHQLSTVKLAKPDVSLISSGEFSYDTLNYLHQDMKVDDSSFTNLLKVEGLNVYGADYYGFYQPQGYWKVLNANRQAWTEEDGPVPIELVDPQSANTKYIARNAGTCYLKYCINDNTYPKFKSDGGIVVDGINPNAPSLSEGDKTEYLTDADINSNAMLEITVTEDEAQPSHTVEVTGSYPKAEVDKTAPKLEDGGLVVSIKNKDGKEFEEQYTWQAQELPARGITVKEDGTVSFDKAGTFHVRAVCEHGIASDWVEIEAYVRKPAAVTKAPKPMTLTYNGQDQQLVTPGEAEGGEMVYWVDGPYDENENANAPTDDAGFTSDLPQGNEAGLYFVWYKAQGDDSHDDSAPEKVSVTIKHATSKPGEPTPGALVYNGQAQALVEAGVAQGGTVMYRLDESEEWSEEIPKAIDAGDYTVWYYVKGDKNHNDTEPDSVSATIEKRALTVTALDASKTYGEADPALTWTAEGLAGSDSLLGKLERTKGDNVGTYAIRQGSLSATDNYALYFNEGLFTIEPRPLTVTAKDASALYGEVDPSFEYTVSGLVGADRVTGRLSRRAGDSVGTYAITQGSLAASGNYDLKYEDAVFTILKRDVTITARDASKTYGETDPALGYTATGLVGLDQPVGALSRAGGEDVGSYAITQGSLAVSNNYNLTFVGGTFAIAPRRLLVVADPQSKVQGDADPVLTYTATGMVNGDMLSGALDREPGEAVGTYAITQGSLAASGNYDIAFIGATMTIEPMLVRGDFTLLAKATASGTKDIKLSWTTVEGAQGYDVYYKKCDGDMDMPLYKSVRGPSVRIRKLKKGTCYKAYVQAWRTEDGRKVYIGEPSPVVHCIAGGSSAKYTNAKSIKLNKTSLTLDVGQSETLKPTVKKLKSKLKVVSHEREVRYFSSNANVAKVSKRGKVTAVGDGTCIIYAITNNGLRAATQVTVKAK